MLSVDACRRNNSSLKEFTELVWVVREYCDRHWCAVTPFLRDAGILVDSGRIDILSSITMVDVVIISILLTSDDQSS